MRRIYKSVHANRLRPLEMDQKRDYKGQGFMAHPKGAALAPSMSHTFCRKEWSSPEAPRPYYEAGQKAVSTLTCRVSASKLTS